MKYLIVIAGGLTDQPVAEKDNRTPLMLADTPHLDRMVREGRCGSVQTLPEGFEPSNDVSLLALLGYEPETHYCAPAALEAVALGVELAEGEIPVCCDFVQLQSSHNDMVMKDFTAGGLSSEDAQLLLEALQDQIGEPSVRFHVGEGSHNLMVVQSPPLAKKLHPPHELIGEGIRRFMPEGEECRELVYIMNQAQIILHNHPYNRARHSQGKDTVNSVWLWGTGNGNRLPAFIERFGKSGAVVTSSLLLTGMARSAGMHAVFIRGTDGTPQTRHIEAVAHALEVLDTHDVVFLHCDDTEILSLQGNLDDKVLAIEDFDSEVAGPLLESAGKRNDVKLLLVENHRASAVLMKYAKDKTPFCVLPGQRTGPPLPGFDEEILKDSPDRFQSGASLVDAFLRDRME